MKKIKFLFAAITLISGLALTSCNKQSATMPLSSSQHRTTSASTAATADLGALHTAGLEYFIENAPFKDPAAEVNPVTLDFCSSEGYDATAIGETLDNDVVAAVVTRRDIKSLQSYFEAEGMKAENAFLSDMLTAINSATDDKSAAKALDAVAAKVSTSKELSEDSRTALLQGITVGKASVSYWYTQQNLGGESAWAIKVSAATGGTPDRAAMKFNWWKLGAQDLAGAIVGGIFGGWMGALGGGIGASVSEAIGQLM